MRHDDVAILVPTRTPIGPLERALDDADIPYRIESRSLVWRTDAVRDLLGDPHRHRGPGRRGRRRRRPALARASPAPTSSCVEWRAAGGRWDHTRRTARGARRATTPSRLAMDAAARAGTTSGTGARSTRCRRRGRARAAASSSSPSPSAARATTGAACGSSSTRPAPSSRPAVLRWPQFLGVGPAAGRRGAPRPSRRWCPSPTTTPCASSPSTAPRASSSRWSCWPGWPTAGPPTMTDVAWTAEGPELMVTAYGGGGAVASPPPAGSAPPRTPPTRSRRAEATRLLYVAATRARDTAHRQPPPPGPGRHATADPAAPPGASRPPRSGGRRRCRPPPCRCSSSPAAARPYAPPSGPRWLDAHEAALAEPPAGLVDLADRAARAPAARPGVAVRGGRPRPRTTSATTTSPTTTPPMPAPAALGGDEADGSAASPGVAPRVGRAVHAVLEHAAARGHGRSTASRRRPRRRRGRARRRRADLVRELAGVGARSAALAEARGGGRLWREVPVVGAGRRPRARGLHRPALRAARRRRSWSSTGRPTGPAPEPRSTRSLGRTTAPGRRLRRRASPPATGREVAEVRFVFCRAGRRAGRRARHHRPRAAVAEVEAILAG